jgi:hypothetical protein
VIVILLATSAPPVSCFRVFVILTSFGIGRDLAFTIPIVYNREFTTRFHSKFNDLNVESVR